MDKKPKTSLPAQKTPPTYDEIFDRLAGKDNPPIEERLLDLINAGNVPLTDNLFFKLLKESHQYLQTEPFQKKLSKWTLENNQKMLNRIQTVLKPERRGRKVSITNEFDIRDKYMKNVKLINDFKKAHPREFDYKLNEMFEKSYPDLKVDFLKHNSAKELAYDLTCNQLNISERSLRWIVKHCHPNAHKIIKERIRKPE